MRSISSVRLGRVPAQRILLFLWAAEEGGAFLERGFDRGILDAVVGEVYKARGLESVENCLGGLFLGGRVAREEG